MANATERKRREIKGGDLHIWGGEHEPTEIEGEFLGFTSGKYGPDTLFKIRREGEVQTWSMPAILHSRLENVQVGDYVWIEHHGSISTKAGQLAHNFVVYGEDKGD